MTGTRAILATLSLSGIPSLLIHDSPRPAFRVPDCLARAAWRSSLESHACSTPRAVAIDTGMIRIERQAADDVPGVAFVDPGDVVCDQSDCAPVRNGLIVYRDGNHLTTRFAASLAATLSTPLQQMVGGG